MALLDCWAVADAWREEPDGSRAANSPHASQHSACPACLPPADLLWRFAAAPYTRGYEILGVDSRVSTNSEEMASIIEEGLGRWPKPPALCEPASELRFFVHEAPDTFRYRCDQPVYRRQGPYFLMTTGASFAFADRDAGFAAAFLTPRALEERRFVQVGFVECLALYLATATRVPLHAAAVAEDGRCALLTADCGAGKSTLACACTASGMNLVSDDVVYLAPDADTEVVWGNPWTLHLTAGSLSFFPALGDLAPTRELSGELKWLVDVAAHWPGAPQPRARVDAVLTLGRASGTRSEILPVSREQVRDTLSHFRRSASPDEAAEMLAAASRLSGVRSAHLRVGSDLGAAVSTLRSWLAS